MPQFPRGEKRLLKSSSIQSSLLNKGLPVVPILARLPFCKVISAHSLLPLYCGWGYERRAWFMPIAPEDKSSIPLRRCPGASIQIRRISKTVRFPHSNWIPTKSGRKRSTVFYGIPGEGPERSRRILKTAGMEQDKNAWIGDFRKQFVDSGEVMWYNALHVA